MPVAYFVLCVWHCQTGSQANMLLFSGQYGLYHHAKRGSKHMLASPDFYHYGFVLGMCLYPEFVLRCLHDAKVVCKIFISAPAYGLLKRVLYSFTFKSCMYTSP